MSKARDLADLVAAGSGLADGTVEVADISDLTASAAELNIMDGVTSTTAELNILDGVTATASELNILDGVTATASELNIMDGVTATTTEINTGTAKAWATIEQIGTHSLLDSVNISSITDSATGISSLAFTSSMTDADYCIPVYGYTVGGSGNQHVGTVDHGTAPTSSAFRLLSMSNAWSGVDGTRLGASVFGELA
jgi:hypothetical protein